MTATIDRPRPFRTGSADQATAAAAAMPHFSGTYTLLADCSEFQDDIADSVYLEWSKAIVIRALYGDAHDDKAWYGGQRRSVLHAGGARFVGVYQFLVGSQSGAAQAQAFHKLVGAIQPGEVFIADFEEGSKGVLTGWYDSMLSLYGKGIAPFLWTYSGLSFGRSAGVLPVEWIAAYQSSEPSSAHKLWQFTDAYRVPGVGKADCSVYHGSIDQLAALAYQPSKPAPKPSPAVPRWPAGGVLREGSTGAAVEALQYAFRDSGIPGVRGIAADGSYGPQTQTACRNFQSHEGLAVDGIAGPQVRASLIRAGRMTPAGEAVT